MGVEVVVIGCGIMGATLVKALRDRGVNVLALDEGRANNGTAPSGGHLKPSWFSGLPKEEYIPAMELLDQAWGLCEEEFVVRPTRLKTKVYRVDTDVVVATPKTKASVTGVGRLNGVPAVTYKNQQGEKETVEAGLLVIATGAWAGELVKTCKVQSKTGVSFRFNATLKEPFIKPWLPYRQVVAHQQSPGEVWVGDGSALLEKNWTDQRTEECQVRCCAALGLNTTTPPIRTLRGNRPYCKTGVAPCLLERLGPKAWLATGAGKSGTIAAGWAARRILDAHFS